MRDLVFIFSLFLAGCGQVANFDLVTIAQDGISEYYSDYDLSKMLQNTEVQFVPHEELVDKAGTKRIIGLYEVLSHTISIDDKAPRSLACIILIHEYNHAVADQVIPYPTNIIRGDPGHMLNQEVYYSYARDYCALRGVR